MPRSVTTGIDARSVLDGLIDGESFTAYLAQFLARAPSRGVVIIVDNLGSDNGVFVRKVVSATGARLVFVPL